jgi:magnesium transporter
VYFYVTGADGVLVGVVPTRRLLLSDPATLVGDVMIHPVFSVDATEPFVHALQILTEKRLLALPVVDDRNRLTGVIDMSTFTQTLFDLERRGNAEELFQIAGVQIEQEKNRTLWRVLGNRFPWLLCNVASGLVAAVITNAFDAVLKAVVVLAFFVPLVLTIAESIAMQSVSMSVQNLHVMQTQTAGQGRWAFREMRIGMLLGVVSGAIVGLIAIAWLKMMPLAAVVSAAMAVAGSVGAALGYFIPRLVHRWNLDPKIASGPAVLAVTDVAAITFYFGFAAVMM